MGQQLGKFVLAFAFVFAAQVAWAAKIKHTPLPVSAFDSKYLFDLYRIDDGKTRPGLVVVPEIWGKDDLTVEQAKLLAEAGYVVLVMDVYGDGANSKSMNGAMALNNKLDEKRTFDLFSLAVGTLRAQKGVDTKKIGAVGYGFGGGLVTNAAKKGMDELKAAVSYYGGLKRGTPVNQLAKKPAVLYFHPENDNYSFDTELKAFESQLMEAKVDVKVVTLKGAQYGFVNKGIEKYGKGPTDGKLFMFYDEKATKEAWKILTEFLKKNL